MRSEVIAFAKLLGCTPLPISKVHLIPEKTHETDVCHNDDARTGVFHVVQQCRSGSPPFLLPADRVLCSSSNLLYSGASLLYTSANLLPRASLLCSSPDLLPTTDLLCSRSML